MKFNPRYLYFLLIPVVLVIVFLFVFVIFSFFQFKYNINSSGNTNQSTKTITVDSYDEINITGSMDVDLIAGKEGVITVTAPSNILQNIKVESQNNALQIYSDQWKYFGLNIQFGNSGRTLVTVPFETLSRITLAGSGKVVSKNPIISDNLITNLFASGGMDLNVEASSLESNTSGSGNIKLRGKATNFVSSVFGSGSVEATSLEAQIAKVSISGSGDIKLWAIQSLEANTFGSGSILYKGNPVANNIKVSGSGEIKKID